MLLNRAWQICSDLKLFHLEVLKAIIILRKNDYPNKVIEREIERLFNDIFKDFHKMVKEVKRIIFLSLPYFGMLSEDFKKRLTNLVQPIFAKVKAIL
jgi:hypothetical protein